MELTLAPKTKRAKGEVCCEPVVLPDVDAEQAQRIAALGKALGDPIRVQLLDVLRKAPGQVCVCELVPLFDVSQPTVSHHLKVLRDAGLVGSEKRGLWVYYYAFPGGLAPLGGWLAEGAGDVRAMDDRRADRAQLGRRGAAHVRAGLAVPVARAELE